MSRRHFVRRALSVCVRFLRVLIVAFAALGPGIPPPPPPPPPQTEQVAEDGEIVEER